MNHIIQGHHLALLNTIVMDTDLIPIEIKDMLNRLIGRTIDNHHDFLLWIVKKKKSLHNGFEISWVFVHGNNGCDLHPTSSSEYTGWPSEHEDDSLLHPIPRNAHHQ